MRGQTPSIPTAIRRTDGLIVLISVALFAVTGSCSGQIPTPSPNPSDDAAFIVRRLVSGREMSGMGLREPDGGVIRVENSKAGTPVSGYLEISPAEDGAEKRIYVLKMESRSEQTRELLEMQRNLLRNQLMVLKVLGVIGKHQGVLGRRLSRTENLNRELLGGMQDTSRGVDMARTDIASTLVETTDISEMTEELTLAVEEIQKQLEDVETGISDLQDTTNEILGTVENIESGS